MATTQMTVAARTKISTTTKRDIQITSTLKLVTKGSPQTHASTVEMSGTMVISAAKHKKAEGHLGHADTVERITTITNVLQYPEKVSIPSRLLYSAEYAA